MNKNKIEVETRFRPGDKVFIRRDGKYVKATITAVTVSIHDWIGSTPSIEYQFWDGRTLSFVREANCFADKDEVWADIKKH